MVATMRSFAPPRPSNLRHVSGLGSPVTLPQLQRQHRRVSTSSSQSSLSNNSANSRDTPSSPLAWSWTCHLCSTTYGLGVTRRCLYDGHVMCTGSPPQKQSKRRNKKNSACLTHFDYAGWQKWGGWKRAPWDSDTEAQKDHGPDCSKHCDFPSQCFWMHSQDSNFYSDDDAGDSGVSAGSAIPGAPLVEEQATGWRSNLATIQEGEQASSTADLSVGLGLDFDSKPSSLASATYNPEDGPTFEGMSFLTSFETAQLDDDPSTKSPLFSLETLKALNQWLEKKDRSNYLPWNRVVCQA
ncbi:MAG: hypothetical protein LQ351_000764 [Letrouitia transgressa]|nr:MAG: hypothetical protein LQ351_000764 [Letrouitia transgressa]